MDTLVICPRCQALNRVGLERSRQAQAVCGKCQGSLPVRDGVQELNGAMLRELVRKSSRPVVVDFWAPWCGPCRAFAPVFQKTAERFAGKIVFAKLNTEADPQAGDAYGIRGIPTLVVFAGGAEADRQSGAMPAPALERYLGRWA